MSGSAESLVAARLLIRVERGAFSSRLLGAGSGPGVRQRVLGVLRWQRALDWVLDRPSRRPLATLDPEVRAVLRLGLFDAVILGVPPAVATDRAVRLARELGRTSAAGLVNAVLRRAVPEWTGGLAGCPLDLRWSHPAWLVERWTADFGAATTVEVLAADQEPAETWAWFYSEAARRQLEEEVGALTPHPWCPGAFAAPGRARALLAVVGRGEAYAQDPASQLVAHLAARLAGHDDGRLAELCAAPGGKLALLLRLRRWQLAVGLDLRPVRAGLARTTVAQAGGSAVVACADATRPPLAPAAWDLVLVDAPCSGTGTLRRHPELRWRLEPENLAELAAGQRALFASGLDLLAPGGVLLYATCSLEPEENEAVVQHPGEGFAPEPLPPLLPDGPTWLPTGSGGVRLLPTAVNDGFTLHAVRRQGSPP